MPPISDEILEAHWLVNDGQLEHAVEDHATAAGASAVEAKHELVGVAGQVCVVVGALVRPQQPPLDQ